MEREILARKMYDNYVLGGLLQWLSILLLSDYQPYIVKHLLVSETQVHYWCDCCKSCCMSSWLTDEQTATSLVSGVNVLITHVLPSFWGMSAACMAARNVVDRDSLMKAYAWCGQNTCGLLTGEHRHFFHICSCVDVKNLDCSWTVKVCV